MRADSGRGLLHKIHQLSEVTSRVLPSTVEENPRSRQTGDGADHPLGHRRDAAP